MSKRWMRGPTINTPGTTQNAVDHTPSLMFWYHFLTKILGFTFLDEVVSGGPTRTFQNGHEALGTNGVLTATDYTFTDATASPFVVGDVGKFLVIVDPTNPENSGIYEIATYVGPTQVTINFYVPGGVFPTAKAGLSWWMFDTNNASYTPVTYGDLFVVRSPHATYPFEMKVESSLTNNYAGGVVDVSPNAGAWNVPGSVWNTGARVIEDYVIRERYYASTPHSRLYAMGDTDGSFALFWNDRNAASFVQATMIALVDPLEATPARSANERVLVAGNGGGTVDAGSDVEVDRGDDHGGLGLGQVWEDYGNQKRWVRLMALYEESNLAGYTDYFSRNIGVNARTGERDALPFMYSIDPEGALHRFAPHSKVPIGHIVMGTAVAVGELASFDNDDYYHLRNGIVIPWNGVAQA